MSRKENGSEETRKNNWYAIEQQPSKKNIDTFRLSYILFQRLRAPSRRRQAAWVMDVTEKTPAPDHGADREREEVQAAKEGGRKEKCLMGETHNKATNLQRLSLIVTG